MPQDPAVIQQQIEETRAELAGTIDAIAEIVSPKRIADRTTTQFKEKVAEVRQKIAPSNGAAELTRGDAPALESGHSGPEFVHKIRWERVGAVAVVVALLVARSRRRRRRLAA